MASTGYRALIPWAGDGRDPDCWPPGLLAILVEILGPQPGVLGPALAHSCKIRTFQADSLVMAYTLYFDARDLDSRDWIFILVDLFFILIGLGMVLLRRRLRMQAFFPRLFFGISLTIGILTGGGLWLGKQFGLPNKLRLNQCEVVEGTVSGFHPMPPSGGVESFSVGDRRFEYGEKVSSSLFGFSEPASVGGPIREGLQVRIHHVDGAIARLEIREPP